MRCMKTRKPKLGVVMKADYVNQPHEVSSGLCSLTMKMIVHNTAMEVAKCLDLVVMRISVI